MIKNIKYWNLITLLRLFYSVNSLTIFCQCAIFYKLEFIFFCLNISFTIHLKKTTQCYSLELLLSFVDTISIVHSNFLIQSGMNICNKPERAAIIASIHSIGGNSYQEKKPTRSQEMNSTLPFFLKSFYL